MTTQTEEVLTCRDLCVTLGGHQILVDIDAQVHRAEAVALLGANGSGKSTLVKALLGLVPISAGSVRLFGEPLSGFTQWQRIGYVPQRGQSSVANATVREIVSTGRLAHRRPFRRLSATDKAVIDESLERVGLLHRAGDPIGILSGGQQQRALIARALASQAELLVMDEPLAALDLDTQKNLTELFGALTSDGLSILVVLHGLGPMAGIIDRCIMLHAGHKVHDGPFEPSGANGGGDHHPDTPRPGPYLLSPSLMRQLDTRKRS
ncbi:metal ABC transporter ATP-binding protein [Propionibacterium australiense]|uniref:ABC transporter n=1 Tax=Propionibacterium australiense TaxID=119981 RepID=A0A383S8J6_9ACTN|nr:ABC transporter ATP-binding protein [Propionibacterium australiense]RLP10928.1 ATP-binding cassette domain-containing protein [Propionibacterium australiense]RLP13105.1 ATP-binding cassette domain-containing protein [Propionibacterium australiense]SYZ33882.1 ABC transporter [Propionibacterium australiense]VEH90874.1 Iron(3+)-hydroxamate import ATP-binding protein FhuC [Propionibacterium australiense]